MPRFLSLRANLVDAGMLGSEAFSICAIEMDKIDKLSHAMYNAVSEI